MVPQHCFGGARFVGALLVFGVLTSSGCGSDDDSTPRPTQTPDPNATPTVIANQPPELAPIGDQTVVLGSDLLIPISATDPEGQNVALDVSSLPANSYFLDSSGVFCFFADDESQIDNPVEITFSATDGERTDTETITVRVVRPDDAARVALTTAASLTLSPVGDHTARVGQVLILQLMAQGASPISFRMYPDPALAPHVTLDQTSGVFRFTPTAALAAGRFEITFQACVPNGSGCDAIMQTHETVHLSVTVGSPSDCSASYVPAGCANVLPGTVLPRPIESCFVVRTKGTYTYEYINILAGGALYFADDPTGEIDFRVKSMLVEQGGVLQAGSADCRFGGNGGKLSIGIYGDDPSQQGTVSPAPVGIQCMTAPMDSHTGCFPSGRDPEEGTFYCTAPDSDDPCSSTQPPAEDAANFQLEHYGNLNFDPTPWGYKVLGVSYGGTLRLFGANGVKTTPDGDHCDAPTPAQSTLDAAEMQHWADLSYSSWARLDGSEDMAGTTVLTLDRAVPTWAVGDEIVVGTTDWYPSHSEQRTVRAVAQVTTPAGPRTQLTVDQLAYPHVSDIFDADALAENNGAEYTGPVSRTAADLRATVGLLTRSITIRSLGTQSTDSFPDVASCLYQQPALAQQCSNTAPGCPCGAGSTTDDDCYFGGHLMFRQGFREVQIQGVEFHQLGQGGRMGHYPVHFHLAKSTAYTQGKAYLKDSSVWDSMTRFVTLHGTHDVALMRNVGYLSVGHGYYIEDGSEIDNLLCQNLGVGARASLKEYFVAQADPANWGGSTPPATARFVPGILDGVSPSATFEDENKMQIPLDPKGPAERNGSDSYMPVMFWMMNAHNEFVGNAAVGVHGFGSCYWLLGSGVSGPSFAEHDFAGLANYNVAGGYQAPLLRFRGNSCTTATYALPASAELSPSALCEAVNTGFTPINNPYVYNPDGSLKPVSELAGKYARPAVVGNFQPIEPNAANATGCAAVGPDDASLESNTSACVTTVLDRFTTSFNWAQVNYGSIWLRPWFYLLLNPAVTDQLFGGVTFVTAGSWLQVPPAYFSLAKNGLFVGSSQHGGSQYAQRSGPIFSVTADDNLASYAPCSKLGNTTCNLESEGIGLWTGGFQPKRLINIYDGPHFADDNLFLNIGAWECDPQPCFLKGQGNCVTDLPCGIYTSTIQPAPNPPGGVVDPHKMVVIDAPIGWKQPNGFYYPPAFTYRSAHFFKKLPTGLPEPDPDNPLNRCFSFGPGDGFAAPSFLPGDCRHNAIDRTHDYIGGNMLALNGGPAVYPAQLNLLPNTPIDFSTILIDLNASLTGASGTISGVDNPVPTTSVSRNAFFDAPAQSDECLSFGVQTSPYEAVTTNVAPLKASPAAGDTWVEPWTYVTPPDPKTGMTATVGSTPVIALYRQWATAKDPPTCGQVCDPVKTDQYACPRGTFMLGPNVGHATYLTLAQPPGLSGQAGSLYYIDTSTEACSRSAASGQSPAR